MAAGAEFLLVNAIAQTTRGENQTTQHRQDVTYNALTDTQSTTTPAKTTTSRREQSGISTQTSKVDGPPSILLTFEFSLSGPII